MGSFPQGSIILVPLVKIGLFMDDKNSNSKSNYVFAKEARNNNLQKLIVTFFSIVLFVLFYIIVFISKT